MTGGHAPFTPDGFGEEKETRLNEIDNLEAWDTDWMVFAFPFAIDGEEGVMVPADGPIDGPELAVDPGIQCKFPTSAQLMIDWEGARAGNMLPTDRDLSLWSVMKRSPLAFAFWWDRSMNDFRVGYASIALEALVQADLIGRSLGDVLPCKSGQAIAREVVAATIRRCRPVAVSGPGLNKKSHTGECETVLLPVYTAPPDRVIVFGAIVRESNAPGGH